MSGTAGALSGVSGVGSGAGAQQTSPIDFVGCHLSLGGIGLGVGGQVSLKRDMRGNWDVGGGPTFGFSLAPVSGGYDVGRTYLHGQRVTFEQDVIKAMTGPSAGGSYTPVIGPGGSASVNTLNYLGQYAGPLNTIGPPIPTGLNGTIATHAGYGPEVGYSPQSTCKVPFVKF